MITSGQKRVIRFIENNLGIRFDGNTKADAQEFISKYMYDSKQKSMEHKSKNRQTWTRINYTKYDHDHDRQMSDDEYYGDMPIYG